MNRLMNTGHRGKKHKLTSGHHVGNTEVLYNYVKDAFQIIEKRTKKNLPLPQKKLQQKILMKETNNNITLLVIVSHIEGGGRERNNPNLGFTSPFFLLKSKHAVSFFRRMVPVVTSV